MDFSDLIIAPITTEKSVKDNQKNKYHFRVPTNAHKDVIKKAIEKKFGVNVLDIATVIGKGDRKKFGGRRAEIKVSPWKKAVIKLQKDQKIDLSGKGDSK